MPKLKSRTKWPPAGFVVLHPEAGMKAPFSGSFLAACDFEMQFRRKNPSLAQRLKLLDDRKAVEEWVDTQNALRCIARGWLDFVDLSEPPSPEGSAPAEKKNVATRARRCCGKSK